MVTDSPSDSDRLWAEYGGFFQDLDDFTLGRWMAQTLGQLRGRVWRISHPLLGAYRLASQSANDRELWQKRSIAIPHGYHALDCCAAPVLPLFSRDIVESGLICEHCGETAIPFAHLLRETKKTLKDWSVRYHKAHQVAHWSEQQKKEISNYSHCYENAAKAAERLLHDAAAQILPAFLDHFPTILWEDQDECLDVRPEDIGQIH